MMRKPVIAAGLTLLLWGCEQGTGAAGAYQLVRSDSGAVPIRLQAGDNCFHMLMSGEVLIATDDRFTSTYTVEKACPGQGMEHFPMGSAGILRTLGDSLVFEDTAGVVVGQGRLLGDTLVVVGPSHTLYYRRQ